MWPERDAGMMDLRYSSNSTKFGTPVLLITLNTINKVSELVDRGINTKNVFIV